MDLWRGISRRMTDSPDRRYSEEDYELLPGGSEDPPHSPHISHPTPRHLQTHRKRRSRIRKCLHLVLYGWTLKKVLALVVLAPVVLVVAILCWGGIPPSYEDVREFERLLPQHHVFPKNYTMPKVQDVAGGHMYIRFENHLWGHGLNNILQEALLLSYVALASNRSYVFEDYVWSHSPFPYTLYDFTLRPTRIPLNAYISGPTAGAPLPSSYSPSLAAISLEHWEKICPKNTVRYILTDGSMAQAEGSDIAEWWRERLSGIKDSCVEIGGPRIFDFDFFGSSRLLSLYPALAKSPILTDFQWSPLVHSTILRNFPLLQPSSAASLYNFSTAGTLTGLVAVHLRRGDYKRHCPRLAKWHTVWNGVNEWEGLPDKFRPPPEPSSNSTSAEKQKYLDYYMQRCLPSQEQIVERLHTIRQDNPGLRRVYVLTNGWSWWLDGLKRELLKDDWEEMKSTLDLEMDPKQYQVGAAVDMAIAERAEVFVGNGFSSLSSNIVMLRMAKGVSPQSNRFL